jgi:hypothetical protein
MSETLTNTNNTNDTEEPDSKRLDETFENLQKSPQAAPGILESHSEGETDIIGISKRFRHLIICDYNWRFACWWYITRLMT